MDKLDLKESIKNKAKSATGMLETLADTAPVLKELIDSMDVEQIITLEIPKDIQALIDKGEYTLKTKKGVMRAVVRDAKTGEIVKHLDLKIKDLPKGFDVVEVSQFSQMAAIKGQLEELADDLVQIQQGIDHTLIGLQNDRIAQYLSGIDLYIQANSVSNPGLQQQLTAQSLMRLNNAYYQISEELKYEMQTLSKNYNRDKLRIENLKTKEIENKIQNINKCFDVLLKTTKAQAAIYLDNGEIRAMLHSMDIYGDLLKELLDENTVEMLYQFDTEDKQITGGSWHNKSKELPALIDATVNQYEQLYRDERPLFTIQKDEKGGSEYVGMSELPRKAE